MLPLLVAAGMAVMQLLAAGAAHEYAGHAAGAGAIALGAGGDARLAAHEAIPGWSRRRLTVEVHGRRVEVRLRPPAILRSVGDLLAAEASADAGPRPVRVTSRDAGAAASVAQGPPSRAASSGS
jgi:hypothetical protein